MENTISMEIADKTEPTGIDADMDVVISQHEYESALHYADYFEEDMDLPDDIPPCHDIDPIPQDNLHDWLELMGQGNSAEELQKQTDQIKYVEGLITRIMNRTRFDGLSQAIKAKLLELGLQVDAPPQIVGTGEKSFRITDGHATYLDVTLNDDGEFSCEWGNHVTFVPNAANQKRKGSATLVTSDPVDAVIAASQGLGAVAIREGMAYVEKSGRTVVSPFDAGNVALNPELIAQTKEMTVLLSTRLMDADPLLAHFLKYHVPLKAVRVLSVETGLFADREYENLSRHYEQYVYAEDPLLGNLHYCYPMFYPANDQFVPQLEKEEVAWELAADKGDKKKTQAIIRKPIVGVPCARTTKTLIECRGQKFLEMNVSNGNSEVVEAMEGVTSSRRTVTFQLRAEELKAEFFVKRDFTITEAAKFEEYRKFLHAQKGNMSHQKLFTTGNKGWYGFKYSETEIVFPAGYIYEDIVVRKQDTEEVIPSALGVRWMSKKGTIANYFHVLEPLLSNSSLAALLGLSVSGMILGLIDDAETCVLHLAGPSGFGKTTHLQVCASLISTPALPRKPNSIIMPWRTTDNALEGPLQARNDGVAFMDEIGSLASKTQIDELVYMLGNGYGKSRAKQDGEARESKRWLCQIISSGEQSLDYMMTKQKTGERGGILFRWIDVMVSQVDCLNDIQHQVKTGTPGRYTSILSTYGDVGDVSMNGILFAAMRGLDLNHGHAWEYLASQLLKDDYRELVLATYFDYLQEFQSQVDEEDRVVHRRAKHLASAMTGLTVLLDAVGKFESSVHREDILQTTKKWLETYIWRSGLPKDFKQEGDLFADKFLEHLRSNPMYIYRDARHVFGEIHGWRMNDHAVFLTNAGFKKICAEISLDHSSVASALKSLPEEDRWDFDAQARPRSELKKNVSAPVVKKGNVKGVRSPANFHFFDECGDYAIAQCETT